MLREVRAGVGKVGLVGGGETLESQRELEREREQGQDQERQREVQLYVVQYLVKVLLAVAVAVAAVVALVVTAEASSLADPQRSAFGYQGKVPREESERKTLSW